ncbi:MAG: serine hydrolase [Verrucomicrobiales bacterium]|nr:serine hydrolase [Verrucomicrobiales bacterium]
MNFSPEKIEEHFRENFSERGELGAAVSIWKGEEEIIALTGGTVGRDDNSPWKTDTLVPVWSATKGPAALTVLLALHEAGLSVNDPVDELWPELQAGEKGSLSFAQLLAHKSGLAALDPGNRPSILQHSEVVKALEKQEPFWQAGFGHGYHPRTSGALMEEIVRRATSGSTLGKYWRDNIARPLDIDFFIGGLSAEDLERVATIYPPKVIKSSEEEARFYRALGDPESLSLWAFSSPRGVKSLTEINNLEYLQSGIPSLGGVGSARALAKFYAVLANRGFWNGVQVIPEIIFDSITTPIAYGEDYTLLLPTAFSAGFMLDPVDRETGEKVRHLFGPGRKSFGQPGAGGSHAFADPENQISFAYVMNQMQSGILPNDKSLGLVNLLYS